MHYVVDIVTPKSDYVIKKANFRKAEIEGSRLFILYTKSYFNLKELIYIHNLNIMGFRKLFIFPNLALKIILM